MMIPALLLILTTLLTGASQATEPEFAYRNSKLPLEQRVDDLSARMTLAEKARQLDMYWGHEVSENGQFSVEKAASAIGTEGIGSIHDLYPESAALINKIQQCAVEKTRLGIPILLIEEGLHGYLGEGSTTFPVPLGIASSWDTSLVYEMGRVIAAEGRAHGVHMVLGPVLDLARDPRWGRTEETYGEDPYLSAMTGLAMVTGLQGTDLKSDASIIAEPKHFAIHGIPESGSNCAPVSIGEREARSAPLFVFETTIRKGGALGVMAAYHELDGIPCTANSWLLTDILRKEWGFGGFVLSDYGAIGLQVAIHKTAASPKEAIINALLAGVDMQFYDFPHDVFQASIIEAVGDGSLSLSVVDRAVGDVLRVKFMVGLFENPYTDQSLVTQRFHTLANRQLALQASRESICLLKNERNLLPLSKNLKSIAIIGPMADVSALGGYSPRGAVGTTVLQEIREKIGENVTVRFEEGVIPNVSLTVIEPKYLHPPNSHQSGLLGGYFDNPDLKSVPAFSRVDTNMAPYWGMDSPGPGVGSDHFSVKWTGTLTAPVSGRYELGLITDDKGRLYWNDQLLIDNWDNFKLNVMMTKEVRLKAGKAYPICLEYGEETEYAGIRLKWRLIEEDARGSHGNDPIAKAVKAARKSDVALVVVGESAEVVGEGRDRANLDLDEYQSRLVKAVAATGTPTVVVLLNGRPLSINWIAKNIPAIIEAWYPGEAGGKALADILFGDVNPSGKLPISFPKSVGQLPIYYNRKPSANRSYVDMDSQPLFPFGYGLSYTTFEYSNLEIEPRQGSIKDTILVSVTINNTGNREGVEVVQLYLNDVISSVTTPVLALKGFARVSLNPGEQKNIRFRLFEDQLALWNRDMKRVVEPGEFKVMVGGSSEDIRLKGSFFLVAN
jgi:beta-glucosidase